MGRIVWLTLLLAVLVSTGCSTSATAPVSQVPGASAERRILTVMTHDSFEVSQSVVDAFEDQQGVELRFLKAGDAGTALNKAILSRLDPLADVFYGVDNTFLSRAIREDIFEPYASPLLDSIPDLYKLDPDNRALPVDYGDVCVNYDRGYFSAANLAPPETLQDLIAEAYRGQLVVENPATSSPGLAFLLATIGVFGEEGYLDYWSALVQNDVLVVNDWESAYYGEFSLHGGSRPLVVSYGSSPPAEVYFADPPIEDPLSGVVSAGASCFRQIEFVGNPARHRAAQPGRGLGRFHALAHLPGGYAAEHVCISGQPGSRSAAGFQGSPGDPGEHGRCGGG